MLNADAGVGKPPAYSDLADRQTRRRPGPSPSRWPRLIPSRIAQRLSARLRALSAATRIWRIAACKGVRAGALSAKGLWHNGARHSLSGETHRTLLRQKSGERGKKEGTATKRGSSSHPRCCQWPWCRPRIFLPPAPCLRTRAGGLFCETGTPPGRESHSMCAN